MLSKPKKVEAENDRSVFEIRFIEYNKKDQLIQVPVQVVLILMIKWHEHSYF